MRAARVHTLGEPPQAEEAEAPNRSAGRALVEIAAVALNPIDVAVGNGRYFGGSPPAPYVPGCEAVGTVLEGDSLSPGTRVYVWGEGLGTARDGTLAERAVASEALAVPLPAGVNDGLAVACGIAGVAGWFPVTERASVTKGDRVLVLGATGTVGRVAVQAARLRGAERVVAAGRKREVLDRLDELGADATVVLDGTEGLAEQFVEACGGEGPTVVIYPLWGAPLVGALAAAVPHARIVNIGQSAGAEATIPSGLVRGKQLDILGHTNFRLSGEAYAAAYLDLLEHAAAGRVRFELESFPLERVAEAWERQAESPGAKLVIEV
jgi:NADPH2:quinone reductase